MLTFIPSCERENEWLEEGPYYIDTDLVPRGGARRRKSMEPKAIANLNGMLVPTPGRQSSARECQSMPATPNNRRDSSLWMHTPEDEARDNDAKNMENEGIHEDLDWDAAALLTPVPKTPAPEAIHRFAMGATPGGSSPEDDDDDNDDANSIMTREHLIQRTCPPKQKQNNVFSDLGEGVLSREKDENVLMKLMAARRKSLQFAPKIASPLSRAW